MKFNTKMPTTLIPFYTTELIQSQHYLQRHEFSKSWLNLERAHILAQSYPKEHTVVHFKMLKFGIAIKSTKEIIGQIPRLLFGGVKSFVGVIPIGNTGGTNVPMLQHINIPADLQLIINSCI